MPGYGVTQVGKGAPVRYQDWVQAGSGLIDAELARDHRPIVLYGLSAGGMETYHVAARKARRATKGRWPPIATSQCQLPAGRRWPNCGQ